MGETNSVQQGSPCVRLLAFAVSLLSCALSFLHLFNMGTFFSNIVLYLVAIYQVIFSLTTMLFEAKPQWVQAFEEKTTLPISRYQDLLIDNAKFLSTAGGRGLFYFFQGTLWLALAMHSFLNSLCGGLFCIVGVVHILMHFGIMPEHIATMAHEGYEKAAHPPP